MYQKKEKISPWVILMWAGIGGLFTFLLVKAAQAGEGQDSFIITLTGDETYRFTLLADCMVKVELMNPITKDFEELESEPFDVIVSVLSDENVVEFIPTTWFEQCGG